MASLNPDGLQQLPVDIILNIVMQLGWEPQDIGSLLGTSKTIRSVLKTHEEHLSRQFASSMDPVLASSIPPLPIITHPSATHLEPKRTLSPPPPLVNLPYTFHLVAEAERKKILSDLSNSPLLNISIPNLLLSLFETSTRICGACGLYGIDAFRNHGLNMLLRLSDARIAGRTLTKERKIPIDDARHSQELWICNQDALALASTLALVWVASIMFDYGDRSTWGAGDCGDSGLMTLAESSAEDSNLLKRQCMYRELVLVHGPYFLWCSVSESEKKTNWVQEMLDEGVGLKEYEREGGPVYRGLQSVLLRRLDGLEGWEKDGWDEIFSAFGKEVLLCKTRRAGYETVSLLV
ncbi:hypothetical protein V496_01277 [Pseudogymnoascus sp. VKM F-4515 (FW-2607)]|nr:hypothetical protein V496_01277 [Pseudogymnoascus sp. VKM F-4515 (FW-2607)]